MVNITKQYKNNKLKIVAPTWMMNLNSQMVFILWQKFKIVSIYHEIMKWHEIITKNPLIYVYNNRINNRIVFKIKGAYQLEFLNA